MLKFYSTNNKNNIVNLRQAVFQSLSNDNGLYMPSHINRLSDSFLASASTLSLQLIAYEVTNNFLGEYLNEDQIYSLIDDSINFPLKIHTVEKNIDALELFHGPTCAFKDFGARFMGRLMKMLIRPRNKDIYILVATSGDTGSAVANGFYDVEGINVIILYPSKKVSHIQEQQLTTLGKNIIALEVQGTFDDCQRLVKEGFLDSEIQQHIQMTSANSINIARLIPQSFYYAWASTQYENNKPIVISVPSGNYGNLTGGLMAKMMGFNIDHFIAVSNANDIVPEYLKTGNFISKPSVSTISNAMDVGNPSNFPRILELLNADFDKIKKTIKGHSVDDNKTKQAILKVYQDSKYLLDPHGAVAYLGVKEYYDPNTQYVFLATAHPAKFGDVIEPIINEKITIPKQLNECLEKTKNSILIGNTFNEFKNFLMSL